MNTKLIVALVIVGVLAATTIGLVAAQVEPSATTNGTTSGTAISNFFGWMGRCFGFRGASYDQPVNITVTNPNTNTTTTYQGYSGFGMPFRQSQQENITVTNPNTNTTTTYQGYGYGGCMGRFFP